MNYFIQYHYLNQTDVFVSVIIRKIKIYQQHTFNLLNNTNRKTGEDSKTYVFHLENMDCFYYIAWGEGMERKT